MLGRLLLALALLLVCQAKALAGGQVVLQTRPSGAEVLLDGRPVGHTPWIRNGIRSGRHRITLRAHGFQSTSFPVSVVDDLTLHHRLTLRPLAKSQSGEAVIRSQPAGSAVYLDGRRVGVTPLRLQRLSAGTHRLRIEHRGYRSTQQRLWIVADLTRETRATLAPALVAHVTPRRRPTVRIATRPFRAASRRVASLPRPKRPKATWRQPVRTASPPIVVPPTPPVAATPRPVALVTPKPPIVAATPRPVARAAAPTSPPRVAQHDEWAAFERMAHRQPVQYGAFYGMMVGFMVAIGTAWWRYRPRPTKLVWQPDMPHASFRPLSPTGTVTLKAAQVGLHGLHDFLNGRATEGVEAMHEAYRMAPCPETIYNLALAWQQTASPMAEVAYRALVQLAPDHRDARLNLAVLLADSEQPVAAVLAYRELLAVQPKDGIAWFNLGNLYARQGSWREAIEAFKRAKRHLKGEPAPGINLLLCKRRTRARRGGLREQLQRHPGSFVVMASGITPIADHDEGHVAVGTAWQWVRRPGRGKPPEERSP